ncbi:MAG: hypothetical protein ACI4V1_00550, partial [Eubacteriales bacterium]
MKNANKFAIREILLNAFFIFAAVTVVGMISNVLLLLLGYLTSMPITAALDAKGYSELESQAAWLTLAVVSMLMCMLCSFAITRAIGANTAQYCVGQGLKRNLNLPVMLVTVALGLAAHAACCIVLANMSMAYL